MAHTIGEVNLRWRHIGALDGRNASALMDLLLQDGQIRRDHTKQIKVDELLAGEDGLAAVAAIGIRIIGDSSWTVRLEQFQRFALVDNDLI